MPWIKFWHVLCLTHYSNTLLSYSNRLHNILLHSFMWYILIFRGRGKKNHSTTKVELVTSKYNILQLIMKCLAGHSNPVTMRTSHWERIYLPVLLGTEEHLNEGHWHNRLAHQLPKSILWFVWIQNLKNNYFQPNTFVLRSESLHSAGTF